MSEHRKRCNTASECEGLRTVSHRMEDELFDTTLSSTRPVWYALCYNLYHEISQIISS